MTDPADPDDARGDRAALPGVIEQYTAVARTFVAARVDGGEEAFVRALERSGGWDRWDRRQTWLAEQRPVFTRALLD